MKYIEFVVVFGIYVFIGCSQGTRIITKRRNRCSPQMTFIAVANLTRSSHYIDIDINVAWCLWPRIPLKNKVEKLYVQIAKNGDDEDKKFFEIDNHKMCKCNYERHHESPAGYEEMRKDYIREINKPNGVIDYEAGLTCKGGPYVFQEWLKNTNIVNPWVKVRRCINRNGCKSSQKKITKYRESLTTNKFEYNVTTNDKCT